MTPANLNDLRILWVKAQKLHDLLDPQEDGDIQDELKQVTFHLKNAIGMSA